MSYVSLDKHEYPVSHLDRADKAIYRNDSRINICHLNINHPDPEKCYFNRTVKEQAKAVAALIHPRNLKLSGESYVLTKSGRAKLVDQYPQANFKEEPNPAIGTAFLVKDRVILTAAHCIKDFENSTYRTHYLVVFNFKIRVDGTVKPIKKTNVFRMIGIKYGFKGYLTDWAAIELDKSTRHIKPLSLKFSDT